MASSTTNLTPEQAQTALRTLLEGPAMSPPVGLIPNFHDAPNLDVFVALTIALCVTFGTLAVLLRMYTKVYIVRALGLEDYVIFLAWLLQIGETIPSGIVTRYGGGTHMWNVQLQTYFKMLYWVNISAIVYGFVVFFIKLSILLQYLRIFAPTRKGNMFIYLGSHLCIWSNLIFYGVETAFTIALCTPPRKIWNPLMTTGYCFSDDAIFQANGIFNVISDFAILILPMPCLWKLRMPLKKKILVITVFATGSVYNTVPMGMWTCAELSIGIIISCLPVIPKFFQHIGPKVSSAFTRKPESTKDSNHKPASATPSDQARLEKVKLPSFKHTSVSIVSNTEKDEGHDLYSQQALPEGKYVQLHEEMAVPRPDATKELMQLPSAKLPTTRDDLERGYGM